MKTLFYKKEGRRYVPVSEFDHELSYALPKGSHLIICYPGGQSTRYNIDPAYAPMIAAGRVAEEAMWSAINKASKLYPKRELITPGQQQAWKKLAEEFGDELCTLQTNSVHEVAEAAVKAMQAEADKLMKHESVRQAYEHFQLMCELVKEHDAETR